MSNKWQIYSKEQLIEAVEKSTSYRQVCELIGIAKHGGSYRTVKNRINELNLDTSHFLGQAWNKNRKYIPKKSLEEYFSNKFPIQSLRLKNRLISEGYKKHQCEKCGLSEWNKKPIPIELHHIDGNSQNNNLSNLEILCPNCHHQTPNFRRNKSILQNKKFKKKKYICKDCNGPRSNRSVRCRKCSNKFKKYTQTSSKRPSKDELINDIKYFNDNKTAIARKYKVSDTSIHKWLNHYSL